MRRISFAAILLTTSCFALIRPVPAAAADAGKTLVPADWKSLHERWQNAVDELNVPGLAIVAVEGDEVVLLDAIGHCDAQRKQPVAVRSPFYLASVTKSFTALGIALLVEQGKVKLDEPVQTYLPRFTLADPKLAETITVRDLLAHRQGLDSDPIGMAEAYFGNINDDRYYMLLGAVEPLGKFRYTNLHYTLAGRIIEAVSGQPWKDFLEQRVFRPIGMPDATCYASRLYANPLAAWPIVERDGELLRAQLVKNDQVMHAAGGMGASAADLGNWLRFQLTGKTPDGRQLVSPELLEQIHTRQVTDDRPGHPLPGFSRDGYALGWFTGSFRDHPMLEHGGGYVGTSTLVSFLPDDNIGVAVLVNESVPNVGLTQMVTDDVYSKLLGLSPQDLLAEVRQISERLRKRAAERVELTWEPPRVDNGLTQPIKAYVGTYRHPAWGDVVVTNSDEALRLKIGTLELRCHALGKDSLRIEISPGDVVEGRFETDDQGAVTRMVVETPDGDAEFRKAS